MKIETPKEYAEELVAKLEKYDGKTVRGSSIGMAIVFIEEVLKIPGRDEGRMIPLIKEDYDFWKEVNTELIKMLTDELN